MGLGSSNSADITSAALKNEGFVGLWSTDTSKLYKISKPATDDGFKSFFTAYNGFQNLRNSDVSGGRWPLAAASLYCLALLPATASRRSVTLLSVSGGAAQLALYVSLFCTSCTGSFCQFLSSRASHFVPHSSLRVCISGSASTGQCESALNSAYGSGGMSFYCMKKSEDGCLEAVRAGEAHVTVVG
eukprot:scaffold209545_cov17-Tisochrysis_lutea.AAC.1